MAQMEVPVAQANLDLGPPKEDPFEKSLQDFLREEQLKGKDMPAPPEGLLDRIRSSPAHPIEPGHLKDGDVNLIYNKAKFFAGRS